MVGLGAAAVLLSGCSGQSASSGPSTSPTPPSVPVSSPAPSPPAAGSPTPVPAPSSAAVAALTDPCTVISVDQMSKLIGTKLTSAKASDTAGTKLCAYTPASLTGADAATVTTQAGVLPGSLEDLVDVLRGQISGSTVSDTIVAGADSAKVLTAESSGAQVVDVIAAKDGIYHQALIGGRGSAEDYETAMTQAVAALVKG